MIAEALPAEHERPAGFLRGTGYCNSEEPASVTVFGKGTKFSIVLVFGAPLLRKTTCVMKENASPSKHFFMLSQCGRGLSGFGVPVSLGEYRGLLGLLVLGVGSAV